MCMACFCCCDHFFIGGIRTSHSDIVPNGTCLQPGILQHHTIIFTEAVSCHMPDILIFHAHRAGIDIIEAHQQIDQCRFSASGRTYNRNGLSRFHLQIQILDQFLLRQIRERYLFQVYFSLYLMQYNCVLIIRNFYFFFNQFKNTCCTCQCILQFCNNTGNLIKRFRILVGITQEAGKAADRHAACDNT